MRIIQQDSKDIPEVKEVVEERLTRQLIAISILSVKKQGANQTFPKRNS